MTDEPSDAVPELPPDPDEIACPRCGAEPGAVCREPNGRKAKRLHAARRIASGALDPDAVTPAEIGRKGGKASGETRKQRRDRLRAERDALVADRLSEEAAALANDAARYDRSRAELRQTVFRVASKAYAAAECAIDGLQTVRLDDEGRPAMIPRETVTYDSEGTETRKIVEVPDVRGIYTAAQVHRLVSSAALALEKLRLEEGKPTAGVHHTGTVGVDAQAVEDLGPEALHAMLERARGVLPGEPGNGA